MDSYGPTIDAALRALEAQGVTCLICEGTDHDTDDCPHDEDAQ